MSRSCAKRTQRGSSILEAAFVLPVILLILIGCIDLGRIAMAYNFAPHAAAEAVRFASLHPETTDLKPLVQSLAAGHDPDQINVAITREPRNIVVRVTVNVNPVFKLLPPITVTGSSSAAVELPGTHSSGAVETTPPVNAPR